MNLEKMRTVYHIIKKSIFTVFLDRSFFIVLSLIVLINSASLYFYEVIFTEQFHHSFQEPFLLSSISSSILLMIYGGYLGNKFFIKEIEEKRMESLFMIPGGRDQVYFGKTLASVIILAIISLISFVNIYLSLSHWGILSSLTISRTAIYILSAFYASLFTFFISIIIGLSSKKSNFSILFTTIYIVISFFVASVIFFPEESLSIYTLVLIFPFLNVRYSGLFIREVGGLPNIFVLLPLISILIAFVVSHFKFRGVRL